MSMLAILVSLFRSFDSFSIFFDRKGQQKSRRNAIRCNINGLYIEVRVAVGESETLLIYFFMMIISV